MSAAPTPAPKWPLKPGVMVHMKGARLPGTNSMGTLQTSTPIQGGPPVRGRSNRRVWALQRRRALSLTSLAQADDTSQRSRARRIRKMFSSADRADSLPSGVFHGSAGGIFLILNTLLRAIPSYKRVGTYTKLMKGEK